MKVCEHDYVIVLAIVCTFSMPSHGHSKYIVMKFNNIDNFEEKKS